MRATMRLLRAVSASGIARGSSPLLAASGAAAVAAVGAWSTSSWVVCEEEKESFSSCQHIGDGLQQEIWKARHSNVKLLEPDNDTVQLLMTKLRNGAISGAEFRFYADRLLNFLAEMAISELPNDEVEVETPGGHTYEGVELDKELESVIGMTISSDSNLMVEAMQRALPMLQVSRIETGVAADGSRIISSTTLPADVKDKFVVIMDPVIGRGSTLELALKLLKSRGVPEDKILVVSVTLTPDAADKMRRYKGVKLLSASIEAGIDSEGMMFPGLGHFESRYRS